MRSDLSTATDIEAIESKLSFLKNRNALVGKLDLLEEELPQIISAMKNLNSLPLYSAKDLQRALESTENISRVLEAYTEQIAEAKDLVATLVKDAESAGIDFSEQHRALEKAFASTTKFSTRLPRILSRTISRLDQLVAEEQQLEEDQRYQEEVVKAAAKTNADNLTVKSVISGMGSALNTLYEKSFDTFERASEAVVKQSSRLDRLSAAPGFFSSLVRGHLPSAARAVSGVFQGLWSAYSKSRASKKVQSQQEKLTELKEEFIKNNEGLTYQPAKVGRVPTLVRHCSYPLVKQGKLLSLQQLADKLEVPRSSYLSNGKGFKVDLNGQTMHVVHRRSGKVTLYLNGEKLGSAWTDDAFKILKKFQSGVVPKVKKKQYDTYVIGHAVSEQTETPTSSAQAEPQPSAAESENTASASEENGDITYL